MERILSIGLIGKTWFLSNETKCSFKMRKDSANQLKFK